jgi:hypothetical protein
LHMHMTTELDHRVCASKPGRETARRAHAEMHTAGAERTSSNSK